MCNIKIWMDNYIDIKPEVLNGVFVARVVMSDYDLSKNPVVISAIARRNDGTYETKTLVYPEDGFDYQDNVIITFFGMYKTASAQIVGVTVNGQDIFVKYSQLKDTDLYIRYDDSPVRTSQYVNIDKIHLDFEVEDTHNPKTLRVVDQSDWGLLEDRTSIIEIITPGMSEPVVTYLGKNQVNIFNSMNLGINCENEKVEYLDLPDGVYNITIKGSPSSYQASRKYLKTDSSRLELDRLWVRSCFLCDDQDKDLLDKLNKAEYLVMSAEANMRLGNECEAHDLMEALEDLIEGMSNCDECNKK